MGQGQLTWHLETSQDRRRARSVVGSLEGRDPIQDRRRGALTQSAIDMHGLDMLLPSQRRQDTGEAQG